MDRERPEMHMPGTGDHRIDATEFLEHCANRRSIGQIDSDIA